MTSLSVRNLSFSVGSKQIIKSVSLSIQPGQVVALLGPNGAGKTTLLKTIMGVNKTPTPHLDSTLATATNIITFNNIVLNNLPIHKRAGLGLVYLPQQTSLFAQMSVNDNLWLVYEYHDSWKNQSPEAFKHEVMQWLEKTNLSGTINQTAQSLSGGQKRKLEIIRSLLMRPAIVLLDEPFAGVDPKSIYELKQIFTDMAATGIGILISDHHVDQLLSIAQHIFVMLHGEMITSGTVQDILQSSYTKESYLGNQFYDEIAGKFLNPKK